MKLSSTSGKLSIAALVAAVVLPLIILVTLFGGSSSKCVTPAASSTSGMGVQGDGGAKIAGLNAKQIALARNTVAVGKQRHLPDSVILSNLMAQATESTFRNLANPSVPASMTFPHDGEGTNLDSVGPNQIRAIQHAQLGIENMMNPTFQANWFYDQAIKVPGYLTLDSAALAQKVEISGPDAYASARTLAQKVFTAVTGTLDASSIAAAGSAATDAAAVTPNLDTSTCGNNSGGGDPNSPLAGPFGQRIIAAATRWIGMQYSWGGGNWYGPTVGIHDGGTGDSFGDYARKGFDCSGLTMYALFQASGGKVRTAHFTGSQQADSHAHPIPLDQKQPGDLIYFGGSAEGSHHVGIYWGKKNGKDMLLNAPQSGQKIGIMPLSGWSGEGMYVRRFSYPGDTDIPPVAPRA